MNFRLARAAILCALTLPAGAQNSSPTLRQKITGSCFLASEFLLGPVIMRYFWWEDGFYWTNPFSNIDEREPYLIDDAWHAWANSAHQDLHYLLLKHYFHVDSPYPSMAMTAGWWMGVEICDAMEKHDRWGFSVDDMIGNLSGVLFWYLKHRHPEVPVRLRSGFRQWDHAWDYLLATPYYFIDKKEVSRRGGVFQYHISKIELVGKVHRDFYAGLAVSKKDLPDKDNLWGLTLGWDNLRWANALRNGWWNGPVTLLGRHLALDVSFTFWFDEAGKGQGGTFF